MKTAIAFLTADRVELTRQSFVPLVDSDHALFWIDGSETNAAQKFFETNSNYASVEFTNVRGGSGAAIAFALSALLEAPQEFTHVGLVENDVLLPTDWFEPTMALFERGKAEGLEVGAVSARAYEDRVLIQRDGYAVMHNLGFGQVIYTRRAAELVLETFRSHCTMENRKVFALLTGQDIGRTWAFRGSDHMLVADWGADRILAQNGLASLALTPSHVEMIGQVPSLEEQGLRLVREAPDISSDTTFEIYRDRTAAIRAGELDLGACGARYQDPSTGLWWIWPHQVPTMDGAYSEDWHLVSTPGFGIWSWKSGDVLPQLYLPVLGPCDILVSGGEHGGSIELVDLESGFTCHPKLPPAPPGQLLQIQCPAAVSYRTLRLTMKSPGLIFYGLFCRERQVTLPHVKFNHHTLALP